MLILLHEAVQYDHISTVDHEKDASSPNFSLGSSDPFLGNGMPESPISAGRKVPNFFTSDQALNLSKSIKSVPCLLGNEKTYGAEMQRQR